MIHVAITRRVRPGRESEFESRVQEFFHRAEQVDGTTGAYLLRPVPGSSSNEYGILRSFESEAARERFYASPEYAEWNQCVGELVEGPPTRRPLHGLEAFFRAAGETAPPPAWKMAILTWIAVNPAVYIFAKGVPSVVPGLPFLVEFSLVNAFVVALLTWGFMPLLTRLAARWLSPPPVQTSWSKDALPSSPS